MKYDYKKAYEQKMVLLGSEVERLRMQNMEYCKDLENYESLNKSLQNSVEQLLISKEQNSYLHQEIDRLKVIIQEQSRNLSSSKKYQYLRESLNQELQRTIQKQEQNASFEVKPFRKNSLYSFE